MEAGPGVVVVMEDVGYLPEAYFLPGQGSVATARNLIIRGESPLLGG
jgi:hypothetical protein